MKPACILALLGCVAGIGLCPSTVRAQPSEGEPLTLASVLAAALTNNADLILAREEIRRSWGTTLAAGEPFDSFIGSRAQASQRYEYGSAALPPSTSEVRELSGQLGWSRRFRNGLSVTPEIVASATRLDVGPGFDVGPILGTTQMAGRITVAAALLRDRGAIVTEAPERAARFDHAAAASAARHLEEQTVLQAASAYWTYLAAERVLQVLSDSEKRARKTVEETAALVKGEERTRADLTQAQGYLSFRSAARMRAEQRRTEAGHQLVVVMGTSFGGLVAPLRPATDFPAPPAALDAAPVARWIERALTRRGDVEQVEYRVASALEGLKAAQNQRLPRLDLALTVGYTGQARRVQPAGFVDLHRDLPGVEALLALTVELPVEASGARGRLVESTSAAEQARTSRAEVERRIRLAIAAAFESVRQNRLTLAELQKAVELFAQTVENEQKKFQLGSSTLFSINQAEESLTSALLDNIDGNQAFALSLARLRFESGTVRGEAGEGQSPEALAQRLVTLPE